MKTRVVVVGIIYNQAGEILICKTPKNLGVYPDQWCIPGGGIDEGESIAAALHREVWEEVGLKIDNIKPLFFRDDIKNKIYEDGTKEDLYMIYLMFQCQAVTHNVKLNKELVEFVWSKPTRLNDYDLNKETIKTFKQMGFL